MRETKERRYNSKSNSTSFKTGHKPIRGAFGKGSKHTEQSKKKISNSLYGKRGKLSRGWKGDLAGYVAIHTWLSKNHGKASRSDNKTTKKLPSSRYEWASISGECKRDPKDYVELCTRCHRKYDNGNLEIITSKGIFKREKFIICTNCKYKNIL